MIKKVIFVVLVALILQSAFCAVQAAQPVEIYVNNQKVISDVPPVLQNGRTLAPIRVISEHLGAKVSWNENSKTVKVSLGGKQIELKINDTKAFINQQKVILDVPAKLINGRTMVPLRFIGEALGAEVHWDDKLQRVDVIKRDESEGPLNNLSSVEVVEEDGGLVARLKTTYPATYKSFILGSPYNDDYRLVLDISNAEISAVKPEVLPNEYIKDIRVGQFSVKPYIARVVFDLKGNPNYRIIQSGEEITVIFSRQTSSRGDDENPLSNKIIVIDPGHGGTDPGAVYSGYNEKDFNLDIAIRLKNLLERSGARVLMTRESDVYVNLYTRADIANQAGAHLFVSIHCNASTNASTSGTMTLYYPSPEKKALAQILQRAMVETLGLPDLGISERPNLVVTRETKMPSALVEVAFMSNKQDLALLKTEEFRQKAAEGLYKGILRYFSTK